MESRFDTWELEQIVELKKVNPKKAKHKIEEYIKKYPNDHQGYTNYASILIILNKLDEAHKVLNILKDIFLESKIYDPNPRKLKYIKYELVFHMLRIYSYQENYIEMYNLYIKYFKDIELDANNVLFYCKKMLGQLNEKNRNQTSYLFRQILQYQEDDFLEHIKKHLPNEQKEEQNNSAVFANDFPITEIIEEVKKYIPSDKKLLFDFYSDTYTFKYYNCGKDNGKFVHYFKVVCFHNTSDIITMCPSDACGELPCVDLSYMIEPGAKKINQIDRFNLRYNKNLK